MGFAVSDTGIGIAAAALERLFTAFTQADSSMSRRFGGSGLGLAISRRLIERMGGRITAESTPGVGSTFRFEVPLKPVPAEIVAGPWQPESASGPTLPDAPPPGGATDEATVGALHVLVAEDNPTNRLVATRMLERMGHRVHAVTNGREAVAAVMSRPYDLILMDMMMPEMDGMTATSLIRGMPGPWARIPIIGLTANVMHADEMTCRNAGMDHFATKPISGAQLAEVIREVVDRLGAAVAPAESGQAPEPPRS